MAQFNVFRRRGGYGFEVLSGDGRSRGWRPTRRWAKSVAQREVLDSVDMDPGLARTKFQVAKTERPLRSTIRGSSRRRSKQNRRRAMFGVAAVIVALVVIAAGVVIARKVRSKSTVAGGEVVINVYAQGRLAPVVGRLAADFHAHYPNTTINVVYGQAADFTARAKNGDMADIYIDHTFLIGWLDAYSTADTTSTSLGYDALEIVLPTYNPKKVKELADLNASSKLRVAICDEVMICGAVGKGALQAKGLSLDSPATVKSSNDAIDMVSNGTADAALVMRTEFASHRNPYLVQVLVDPPGDGRVDYAVRRGHKTVAAQTFIDYFGTADGTNVLKQTGLLAV